MSLTLLDWRRRVAALYADVRATSAADPERLRVDTSDGAPFVVERIGRVHLAVGELDVLRTCEGATCR